MNDLEFRKGLIEISRSDGSEFQVLGNWVLLKRAEPGPERLETRRQRADADCQSSLPTRAGAHS